MHENVHRARKRAGIERSELEGPMERGIDFEILEKSLGYPIQPMIIILDGNMDSAFHRKPIKLNMKSEKHTGYAVQWFGLATVLLIIYFIVNTKRLKKSHD